MDSLFHVYRDVEFQNPDSAIQLYLSLAEDPYYKSNNHFFVGVAYEFAGLLLTDLGRVKQSIPCFDSSYVYAVKCDDFIGASTSKNNVGMAYQMLGYQNLAIEYYLKGINIAKKNNDTSSVVLGLTNIGSLYFNIHQLDNAIKFQRQAYSLAKQYSSKKGVDLSRLCIDLSFAFWTVGMRDSSVHYSNLSKTDFDYQTIITRSTIQLMDYRLYREYDYPKAKTALKEATEMLEAYSGEGTGVFYHKIIEMYGLNARDAIYNKDYEGAEGYYQKCLKIALDANSVGEIRFAYSGLRDVAELKRQFEEALRYAKLSEVYGDSIFNIEKEKLLQQHAIVYETEQREQKLKLKEFEVEQTNQKLKQKNLLIAGTLFLIILLVFSGYLFFRSIRLKRQLEKQEVVFNERKRISAELHDDIGAKLSAASMFLDGAIMRTSSSNSSELVEKSFGLVNSSINQLRDMVNDLQNTTLEQDGYLAATNELIRSLSYKDSLRFALMHSGLEQRLEKNMEHHLFRITQELINNTLKYAEASEITINLDRNHSAIKFHYRDNGNGFDTENQVGGSGLNNIAGRVNILGGRLKINSTKGNGMTVTIIFE